MSETITLKTFVQQRRDEITKIIQAVKELVAGGLELHDLTHEQVQQILKGRFDTLTQDVSLVNAAIQEVRATQAIPPVPAGHGESHVATDAIPLATTESAGLLSASEKAILNGLTGDVGTHYHEEDRDLANAVGSLPLVNNSTEVISHLNDTQHPHGANFVGAPFALPLLNVAGSSVDVSGILSSEVAGGGEASLGLVTDAPFNRVVIKDQNMDTIKDLDGNDVYGRLTFASGVWTLSFYTFTSVQERQYSFATAQDVWCWVHKIYTPGAQPVYHPVFTIPNGGLQIETPLASESIYGKVIFAMNGENSSFKAVQGNDSRLVSYDNKVAILSHVEMVDGNPHGTNLSDLSELDAAGSKISGVADGVELSDVATVGQLQGVAGLIPVLTNATEASAGVVVLAASGNTDYGKAVQGSDARLAHAGASGNPHATSLSQLSGLNADGRIISGVADAISDTDVVSLKQVQSLIGAIPSVGLATVDDAGKVLLASDGESAAGKVVQSNDMRLLHISDTANPHATTLANLASMDANDKVIANLGDGVEAGDAVNLGQAQALVATAEAYARSWSGESGKLILCPEFNNCVLSGLSYANQVGTMTKDHDMSESVNYYKWTTAEATEQSYGIVVMVPVPFLFSAMSAISFKLKEEGSSSISVAVSDTLGTEVMTFTHSGNPSWTNVDLSAAQLIAMNTGNWEGDMFKITFGMSAMNNEACYVGPVSISYAKSV